MEIQTELKARAAEIDGILERYLPAAEGPQRTAAEAMRYSVMSGGKRVRPILMRETFRLFGGSSPALAPFLAAIEFIHSYSLVHDDLPAMDDDEYRRGRKSTHAVYGEAMGILAGDALLNYAFETAAEAFTLDWNSNVAKALRILGRKAGIYGMVGGQAVDVQSGGKRITPETLLFLHQKKCGALIEASMMIGAALAGADDGALARVESLAADVGLAFQIRDDILDVTSTQETLGKPVGSDKKNKKVTYVTMYGLEKAEREVRRLSERASAALEALPGQNDFLKALIVYMIRRDN